MGLDDFNTDDSTDTEEDETSESTSSTDNTGETDRSQETIVDPVEEEGMNFYGATDEEPKDRPMERKGAMSNHSMADLAQTIDAEVAFGEDHTKLHLPIFTLITRDEKYKQGSRYQLRYPHEPPKPSWNGKVVSCIGVVETRLGSMNKEVAMFDAGSTSKKRVMDKFDSELGQNLDADTTVYINFLGDAFFLRDMAQANEEFREGDILNRDKIANKIINPKQLRVDFDLDN